MKKLLLTMVLCLAVNASHVYAKGGHGGGGGHLGGFSGITISGGGGLRGTYTGAYGMGYRVRYAVGRYYGGHYYPGGYYGNYQRYYYRGFAPRGAIFGFFLGGAVIRGGYSPFWWPYYAVAVPPAYYDPYYQYPYTAPPYVVEVPPLEATTAHQQGPLIIEVPSGATAYPIGPKAEKLPPNRCYAPTTDAHGNLTKENGNVVPDFSKPVPCPPQQGEE